MGKTLLLLACCLTMATGYSQSSKKDDKPEELTSHRVMMGETVVMVAKKFKVTPKDIYEYNPGAVEGISQGTSLTIPLHRQVDVSAKKPKKQVAAETVTEPVTDTVYAQTETAGFVADVQETVTEEIPAQPEETAIIHKVQKGDTLYGISKKYGVSVEQLNANNPKALKRGLQPGQEITIKSTTNH
ncbi:hypothetical protein AM493_07385 [Flavobacterium akiainvivens]|uniref:LysM domain-containing protein n=1 Tax=Flavobacterium akiainvivens TaxID=1202724 RepID=A0A0M8MHT8_9FLAO|nr:LysM domain-containing protein [Flavobacterium akiainvivens]KOS05878.1 hypothetical protein AM493_07385 [Flavobacterium akiainvivens]SFQ56409.1 LysM domain-containing protein [Flavobacterium akiainvivens]